MGEGGFQVESRSQFAQVPSSDKATEICEQIEALRTTPAATKSANAGVIDACWRTELDEIVSRLGAAITQSIASDDQIIMDHVKAAHEIAKVVRRQA